MTDLITGGLGNQIAAGLAKKLGIDESKATWILAIAVPLIAGAIKYNQSKGDSSQAKGFADALDTKHTGEILNNVDQVIDQGPTEDGNKIVQHIFGANTDYVAQGLSQKSGFSSAQITGVLATLAPIVMGYLGKEKANATNTGASNPLGDLLGGFLGGNSGAAVSGGIGDLIGNLLGGEKKEEQQQPAETSGGLTDLVSDFFDKNKDGSAIDDIVGMFAKK
ncbi:DUF937 domain-containing protein [Sphingobacterium sp. SRCM116780]|uniref:DUF937 domain-containing protein n=1 Tax=Sphingobacterium sp. SRCM116780 TaxID=2907623 RepID=UPI001F41BF2D|nr:DUF937 domain-containing protein [Sphingobacterium sp. SRCM116780]UIR57605.1 DUF937 domain-containing protein [Sphingobacterium sp. SRCM116780]